jgi:small ligand-binding sensory domain FIST
MAWLSLSAEAERVKDAFDDITAQIADRDIEEPDCILFFATDFESGENSVSRLSSWFTEAYPNSLVLGASAAGVVGAGHEYEHGHALSVCVMRSSGVQQDVAWIEAGLSGDALRARLDTFREEVPDARGIMLLVDPFSVDIERILDAFDEAFEDTPIFGGLVSGAQQAGGHALSVNGEVRHSGALMVAFSGNLSVDVIVAQGCRPIGEPYIITGKRGNLVDELDRGTPMEVLREIIGKMPPEEQELAMSSLFVGLDMRSESCVECGPDDFLIRNILGIDPESGSMAIGAIPEMYQVMQFHVRDRESADHELTRLLNAWKDDGHPPPSGIIQFSCLGRGEHLFGVPNHDVSSARSVLATEEISGFFCNGEIGPVGSQTYLHGYTTTFAIFSTADT